MIVTANFHTGNDAVCIWAAEQREHGAQFYVAQHGGHYGVDRFEAQEEHELQIADRYFSWGWERAGHANIVVMPSMQLSAAKTTPGKPGGDILFIYDAIPAYAYRLLAVPIAGQRQSLIADQAALISALPETVRSKARLRLHPASEQCHFHLRDAFEDRGWGARIDDGRRPMLKALASARLCVATANATSFLYSFVMDYPTVLFLNPRFSEVRADARPYYDALHEAGILHYSPESAARKIAEIFVNPRGWWSDPLLQKARRQFVTQFARTSPNWMEEWRRELQKCE